MDLRLPTDFTRRSEPTSAKRAQVERDVLAAVDELLRDGARWNDLSIERIATAAGISRTAFYFYFKDKREVLMRLLADVGEEVWDASLWLLGASDDRELLHVALRSVRDVYEAHGTLLRAVVEVSAVDETVATFFRQLMDGFVEMTVQRAEALRSAGAADPILPARATALALMTMTVTTFYEWQVRGVAVTDEDVGALAEIWVRAIYGA